MKVLEVLPYYKKNDLWVVPFIREAGAGQTRGQFAFTFEKNAIKRHTELTELVAGDGQYIGRNTKRKKLFLTFPVESHPDIPNDEIHFLNPSEPIPFPKKKRGRPKKVVAGFMEVEGDLKNMKPPPLPVKGVSKRTPPTGKVKEAIKAGEQAKQLWNKNMVETQIAKGLSPTRKKKVELKKRKQFFEESIKAEKTGKVTTRRVTSKTRPVKRPTNNLLHYVTETGTRRFDLEPVAKRVSKNGKRLGRPRKKKTLWQTLTFWKN